MEEANGTSGESAVLQEILASLKTIQQENTHLAAAVDAINGRVNILAGVKQVKDMTVDPVAVEHNKQMQADTATPTLIESTPSSPDLSSVPVSGRRSSMTSKIILTSYPGQAGVDPLPMDWGNKDPSLRGPVVVSRNPSSIRRRNAIGAHGGSYAICTCAQLTGSLLEKQCLLVQSQQLLRKCRVGNITPLTHLFEMILICFHV